MLADILANRRWIRRRVPFPHVVATNVFHRTFYRDLEAGLHALIGRGLAPRRDPTRLARGMRYSDAFAWQFPPTLTHPFDVFYSRDWHDMLARFFDVSATGDVAGAIHHNQAGNSSGHVHRDVGRAYFSSQPRADGINPADLSRCPYTVGPAATKSVAAHTVIRAVTMIYYLGNPGWAPGDGGETGLYRTGNDSVDAPVIAVPPISNSILVWQNTPDSYHAFIGNVRRPRNSVILWLHRAERDVASRRPSGVVNRWHV